MAKLPRHHKEEDQEMVNMHLKACFNIATVRKLQIKTIIRHQYTIQKWHFKIVKGLFSGKGAKKLHHAYTADENVKMIKPFGKL